MSQDRERLQSLSRRLLGAQELERRRVAHELHDEIGQTLAGLKMRLGALSASAEAPAGLAELQEVVNGLVARVRELSFDLRPTLLDDLGLVPALLWLFERYGERHGLRVQFTHAGADRRFERTVETALYRIVQEALDNVAAHAGTDEAIVRLWVEGDALRVIVEDSGAGFDAGVTLNSPAAEGLATMMERATAVGGYLTVESEPGAGTCILASVPIGDVNELWSETGDEHRTG